MSQPFLGMVAVFGFNFAPRGWALCQGQILPIAQNTALFSLLGTMYGGNGQTTFALPDLRGRFPNSFGQGPGLSNYTQGQVSGTESITLTVNNMPAHNHLVNSNNTTVSQIRPGGNLLGKAAANNFETPANTPTPATMAPNMITPAGSNQPFASMNPYLTLNYCIALEGIFPSRN